MAARLKRAWLALIIALTLLLLLLALLPVHPRPEAGAEEEPVTITLVYAYQNSQWNACVEEVIRQFEAANPHIKVSYEIRYEDVVYEDLLNKLAARDELGDVVQLKEPYGYAESGLIAPLPQTLAEQCSARCEVDGAVYAVAALSSTTGIVYNKALFRAEGLEVPETYQDFLSLCTTLRRRGITPLGVGGKDLWHLEYWLNHFLRADVLSVQPDFLAQCSAGARDWGDGLITDMLTHLSELFRRDYVDDRWRSTPDGALAYQLAEGEIAMAYSGPWLASDVLEQDSSAALGWFYVPNTEGQVVAGESVDVFWSVTAGCARDEARYAAAVAFLEFFYSEGVYEQLCASMAARSTLIDPARGWYQPTGVLAELDVARQQADLQERAYIGDENTPPGFEKQLLNLLVALCDGSATVAQVQAEAQEAWARCASVEAAYD